MEIFNFNCAVVWLVICHATDDTETEDTWYVFNLWLFPPENSILKPIWSEFVCWGAIGFGTRGWSPTFVCFMISQTATWRSLAEDELNLNDEWGFFFVTRIFINYAHPLYCFLSLPCVSWLSFVWFLFDVKLHKLSTSPKNWQQGLEDPLSLKMMCEWTRRGHSLTKDARLGWLPESQGRFDLWIPMEKTCWIWRVNFAELNQLKLWDASMSQVSAANLDFAWIESCS